MLHHMQPFCNPVQATSIQCSCLEQFAALLSAQPSGVHIDPSVQALQASWVSLVTNIATPVTQQFAFSP